MIGEEIRRILPFLFRVDFVVSTSEVDHFKCLFFYSSLRIPLSVDLRTFISNLRTPMSL